MKNKCLNLVPFKVFIGEPFLQEDKPLKRQLKKIVYVSQKYVIKEKRPPNEIRVSLKK